MQDRAGVTTKERVSRMADAVVTWAHSMVEAMVHRGGRSRVRRLQIIESLELGNRRQLFLVACDDQPFLVGAGADRLGTLIAVPLQTAAQDALPSGVQAAHLAPLGGIVRDRKAFQQSGRGVATHGLQLVKAMHDAQAGQAHSVMDIGNGIWP